MLQSKRPTSSRTPTHCSSSTKQYKLVVSNNRKHEINVQLYNCSSYSSCQSSANSATTCQRLFVPRAWTMATIALGCCHLLFNQISLKMLSNDIHIFIKLQPSSSLNMLCYVVKLWSSGWTLELENKIMNPDILAVFLQHPVPALWPWIL